eukprot:1344112-Pyramimonas_sp.AAC.1
MDSWTLSMKRKHPTFSGDEFREKLLLCAAMQYNEMGGIGARHASIRRHLTARSVQCQRLDIQDASAEFLFQQ